jgi:bifunctional non-homologous end joining protein LigD
MQRSHFLLWQGDGGDESPPEAESIFVAPFEQGEIGPDLFRAACGMGLEGLVSKRREALSGWQVEGLGEGQEPAHPAMQRVMDAFS